MNPTIIDEILGAAIKAPSGHNTQPWLFEPQEGGDSILVMPDASRRLPSLDPFDRELYISMGCAIENMCIAATRHSLRAVVEIADDRVNVTFKKMQGMAVSPLAGMIGLRHTNRNAYDGKTLPASVVASLAECGARIFTQGSAQWKAVKEGIVAANSVIYGDSGKRGELKDWIRYNRREADGSMDGLGYDVLGIPDMPSWISRAATSLALKSQVQSRSDLKRLASSPCVAAFASGECVDGWVDCGRRLQRCLLTATLHGVACAFIGAPCEVEATASQLTQQLQLPSRLQVLLRLGYAPEPQAKSRRRPLDSFKRSAE